jgi:hypothetical protein
MFDFIGKLGEVKKKMEEIRLRLDHVSVDGESAAGKIKVTVTANRKVKSININPEFFKTVELEELQDLLEIAMNNALDKAEKVADTEMKGAGRDLIPGFPNI